jgi:hypothetical protein
MKLPGVYTWPTVLSEQIDDSFKTRAYDLFFTICPNTIVTVSELCRTSCAMRIVRIAEVVSVTRTAA